MKSPKKAAVTGHERRDALAAKARAKADAAAAQPSLPGLGAPAPTGGLHGSERGGRR